MNAAVGGLVGLDDHRRAGRVHQPVGVGDAQEHARDGRPRVAAEHLRAGALEEPVAVDVPLVLDDRPVGIARGRAVEADGLAGPDRAAGHRLLPGHRDVGLRGVRVAAEADDRREVVLARVLALARGDQATLRRERERDDAIDAAGADLQVGRVGGGVVGGVERGVGAAVGVVAGEAELRVGADAQPAADDEPAVGERDERRRVEDVRRRDVLRARAGGAEGGVQDTRGGEPREAEQVRGGAGRALDGGDGERGAAGIDAQPAAFDLIDGGGGAVEVGDRVAGGARAVGRVERAGGGQPRDEQLVPRRGRAGARQVHAPRPVEGDVGERRTRAAEPEGDFAAGAEARVTDAAGGQADEQPAIGPAAGGRRGEEDVAVGRDGEAAQLRLGPGGRHGLAGRAERRVEVPVGGQPRDDQRRREVDRQRGASQQHLSVGQHHEGHGCDARLRGDHEQPRRRLIARPRRIQLAVSSKARHRRLAAGRAPSGEEAPVGQHRQRAPAGAAVGG